MSKQRRIIEWGWGWCNVCNESWSAKSRGAGDGADDDEWYCLIRRAAHSTALAGQRAAHWTPWTQRTWLDTLYSWPELTSYHLSRFTVMPCSALYWTFQCSEDMKCTKKYQCKPFQPLHDWTAKHLTVVHCNAINSNQIASVALCSAMQLQFMQYAVQCPC